MKTPLSFAIFGLLSITSLAERTNFTLSERTEPISPEEQLKMFKVPEGFVVELVASEKNGLINPIDLTFDDAGRLWTQTAQMYPLDPVSGMSWGDLLKHLEDDPEAVQEKFPEYAKVRDYYQLKTRGEDKILIIDDPTEQVEGQIPSFAEGLAIPQSILPYKNGVYVAHGSEMLFLEDTDGDGQADSHKTVLTGFGFNDSHTMSHLLVRGPGGWVHFSHGALNAGQVKAVASGESTLINYSKIARFSLDGNHIEVLNNGINNIWGFQLKANGQWFGSEANDMGFSILPFHPMMGYRGIGNDKLRPYQPFAENIHQFRVGGTGLSGLAYDENGSRGFPEEWKGCGFLANPIKSSINAVVCDRNPDGSPVSKHLPDFLTCDDDWFRPVNLEFGPDGCLYIVDWYNKVVSHNEVSRDHPDRDKAHGRIWRVRHQSQKPTAIPNLVSLPNDQLVAHLSAEILWEKRAAWHQIVDRQAKELIPQLQTLVKDANQTLPTRIHALWCLEGLQAYDHTLWLELTRANEADLRREVIRSLASFDRPIEEIVALVKPLAQDPHYMVKEQVLRTLAEVGKTNQDAIELLVAASVPAANSNAFGKGYEANFQRFLARKAFEQYPEELSTFLKSDRAQSMPTHSLEWATEAVGTTLKKDLFVKNWTGETLTKETLISITPLLEFKEVFDLIKPQLATPEFLELALEVQPEVSTAQLHKAVVPGLKNLVDSEEHRPLVIRAARAFSSDSIDHQLPQYGYQTPIQDLSLEMLDGIGINPATGRSLFYKVAESPKTSTSQKARALSIVYRKFEQDALVSARKVVKALPETDHANFINSLTQTSHGSRLYLELVSEQLLGTQPLTAALAERVASLSPKHPAAKPLLAEAESKRKAREAELQRKLTAHTKAIQGLTGNPDAGKSLFSSCLTCHQAEGQGLDIAPALDGSANRDLAHLLTAIVKPDEAVEGGYRLYRVVKKDGEILEGYLYSSTENGVTLASMGGGKTFVPKEHIAQQRHLKQSFMPDIFGDLPEQSMADLVAYIQTLK